MASNTLDPLPEDPILRLAELPQGVCCCMLSAYHLLSQYTLEVRHMDFVLPYQ